MTDKVFETHCKKLNQKWKPADRHSAPFQKPEYFDGFMYYGHGQVLVRQKSDHVNTIDKLPIPVDNVFERYGMSSAEQFEIEDVKHFYDMIHPFYAEIKKSRMVCESNSHLIILSLESNQSITLII